jgi:hypothetical protein
MHLAEFQLNFDLPGLSESRRVGLLLLVAFLASFGFIRMSARLMRSPRVPWWPGSIKTEGGLHVHHLVFGIILLLLAGFLGFALQPDSPWIEILAVAFGIGAGLTLDEYALFLHLEDVYWAEEGRRSIDATIMAAIVGMALVIGIVPLGSRWVIDLQGLGTLDSGQSVALLVGTLVVNLVACGIAAFKGKTVLALVGMFIAPVGWVAAIRLAKPGSPWARRRYPPGSAKLAKAEARHAKHEARRRRRLDLIGGAPTPAEPIETPAAPAAEPRR